MNMPSFKEGLLIAFGLSFFGSVFFYGISLFVNSTTQFYLTASLISLFYIIYLTIRSKQKTGRVTAITLWLVITLSSWISAVPISLFIIVQLAIIWMLRSLYFYSSFFSSIADLLLTVMSVSAAIWAGFHSGALFLALWSLFLMQSLFIFIPAFFKNPTNQDFNHSLLTNEPVSDFDRAYNNAKQALGKLAE